MKRKDRRKLTYSEYLIRKKMHTLLDWIFSQKNKEDITEGMSLIKRIETLILQSETFPEKNRFYFVLYQYCQFIMATYLIIHVYQAERKKPELKNKSGRNFFVYYNEQFEEGKGIFADEYIGLKDSVRSIILDIRDALHDDNFSTYYMMHEGLGSSSYLDLKVIDIE